jgi:hypothetical protein
MTSKITFSNVKHLSVKSPNDVNDTERKYGKLQADGVPKKLLPGLKIDVLVLTSLPVLTTDDTITFDEDDIRPDTRRQFTELKEVYKKKNWLLVHTDFFKKIKEGDSIVIILHEI